VLPAECVRLHNLATAQDYAAALRMHEQLVPLHAALFREPNPAGIKFAASLLGICSDECRLPMVPLAQSSRDEIWQALLKAGASLA
jgi:4-hydroxy-tetrahydrodipicolinate synthase